MSAPLRRPRTWIAAVVIAMIALLVWAAIGGNWDSSSSSVEARDRAAPATVAQAPPASPLDTDADGALDSDETLIGGVEGASRVYYVANGGNDSAVGTYAAPLATDQQSAGAFSRW